MHSSMAKKRVISKKAIAILEVKTCYKIKLFSSWENRVKIKDVVPFPLISRWWGDQLHCIRGLLTLQYFSSWNSVLIYKAASIFGEMHFISIATLDILTIHYMFLLIYFLTIFSYYRITMLEVRKAQYWKKYSYK